MKGILEFTLPEDLEDFSLAQTGHLYRSVLAELDRWLRTMTKYEGKETVTVTEVRSKIHELAADDYLELP